MTDLELQVAVTLKIVSHKHFPIVGIWDANKTAETYQNLSDGQSECNLRIYILLITFAMSCKFHKKKKQIIKKKMSEDNIACLG